ncbi:Vi polysaccharide biosynthesis UDP-N-acetylglucosamine C-6 dehydrogenase TviB [Desulfoprunum benzoelyticum]|uniref:UDP-N-acetyl-D-galactosamine dehydrogenase n=1 Tax=Desulfoprunum benzoelyticum TaxID=1506996 RepID=A0A840ULK7_9BACT|nr:Vi polysaccharide biosynthesis UDP-N-acetylglucosamine C-6 dehydrogenase TviB [Desulfoprunum benzoelyticum]MBB5346485.1 UDP-N-acetyl-D-galactosamine dehydrogenase [Desulfoprunum benzoelyticum]MBM9528986.1 Vi polysaccharide biosynthesis UDP-N-acetylglucosamine C-6 dehydrogenase TviB [Desulfoprunum benzoelyticum]
MLSREQTRIAVIGLGYVGLPLAVEFGKYFDTMGFDLNTARIAELAEGRDSTLEVGEDELRACPYLRYTTDPAAIAGCNVFIVAVPTPIDASKRPNLQPLVGASRTVGSVLKKGDVVVYESTVYPGATEEVCVPVLEQISGLVFNTDFYCGYSPERINPGDKKHRLPNIVKITSGSTPAIADFVDRLYGTIVTAGTFPASSIKVAEAAKVIENTQRDVNIALVNELALIFDRLNINTREVLQAAGTKWNFLPFQPGLVGGHCIGVDPYYLTHKAQEVGFHPDMILAGRRVNDNMGHHIAASMIKLMSRKGIDTSKARVLVLGLSFKENCPDLRNTRVIDIIGELEEYGMAVDVHDPWVNGTEALREYRIRLTDTLSEQSYDGIVVAVAHRQFVAMQAADFRRLCRGNAVIYDVKNILPVGLADGCL